MQQEQQTNTLNKPVNRKFDKKKKSIKKLNKNMVVLMLLNM